MPRRGPLLVAVAMTLFLAAWVPSTKPFASLDEPSHYLRALGIANGSLVGPRVPYSKIPLTRPQSAWLAHDTRGVLVPPGLSPPHAICVNGRASSALSRCLEPTYTGDYQPLPFLLPAVVLRLSDRADTALWLSRLVNALSCLAFILLAIALCGPAGWPLVGLMAAATPMTYAVSGVLNPEGLEIAANLAFLAALLRLVREPESAARWAWPAAGISGAAVILAWQLGPIFIALDVAVLAVFAGRLRLRALLGANRRARGSLGITLVLAFAVFLAYGLSSGVLHSTFDLGPLGPSLASGFHQLGRGFQRAIGVFGLLTVHLPAAIYWCWGLLLAALTAGALLLAPWPLRLVLMLVALLTVAFPVLFYAAVYRHSGFSLQGRYVLPVLALLPMISAELIDRFRSSLSARTGGALIGLAVAAIAICQVGAWWIDARYSAGRESSLWFLSHPAWSPPLGWWPWTTVACLGAAVLLGLAVSCCRPSSLVVRAD